jgi:oligopeptide transport system ATP-binding protein
MASPSPREDPVLEIEGLDVRFDTPDGEVHAVRAVNLTVHAGETLAIVGESGSGKSQMVLAALGLLAANGRAAGSVRYRGSELLGLAPRALNRYRGAKLSMIFQEPMTSLDPHYRIERQIAEPLVHHRGMTRRAARPRVLELLELVGIPDAEDRLRAYPHELSGGQRQRVMIAMALANEPDLLIADEPTTALDVTIQAQILDLLAALQTRLGMAVVFITHDLGIVRRIAQRVVVMNEGRVVEQGPTARIFSAPREAYTKMLLAAEPTGSKAPVPADRAVLLEGRGLRVTFAARRGLFGKRPPDFTAVDGITLQLRQGQTLGVVGESGSGKTTLGRALLRLLPSDGEIRFAGEDIQGWSLNKMRRLRKNLQLVFQDPYGSLSPRMTVGEIVTEGLLVHEPGLSSKDRDRRCGEVLEEVRLDGAARNRYPHEFSGGQRQRIAIARALILKPKVIVLDEPTSALDRSVQKQIIDLLRDLQTTHGLSYIFISHDLAVVRALADEVLVMKDGRCVEQGTTKAIFEAPREAYTRALLAAAFDLEAAEPQIVAT